MSSFDGFESYLYKTGYYEYNPSSKTFSSSSFVENVNEEAARYDKFNRDSLVNNTPEHILVDKGNDEYLIFLSMIGHYFDNLYLYISSLPSQKSVENDAFLSRKTIEEMLTSLGWKIDASLETLNLSDNYLDTSQNGSTEFSAEERTRQVWNRILNTLPAIYKTKGVEECIRLVLSCYGIPSTLINLREYGGTDYTGTGKTSYSVDEKIYMLTFHAKGEALIIPFQQSLKTLEFKVALDPSKEYKVYKDIPLFGKGSGSFFIQGSTIPDFSVGVRKEPEQHLGRVYFELSGSRIMTEPLPIFNGDIFNVMVRKNYPDVIFEYNQNLDLIPTKYDLWIQRREDSRAIYSSITSSIFDYRYNSKFSRPGMAVFGNVLEFGNESGSFHGVLDKILMWDTPISDANFEDHCNNINSYSYTGSSVPHETLLFRMNYDYPENLYTSGNFLGRTEVKNRNEYYSGHNGTALNFKSSAYSSSIDNCVEVTHSCYPYQFKEISYNQTYTINSYGPNKFKNEKIHEVGFELETRLDPNERSTYTLDRFVSPDSNQIGLFADPSDYKNKDIFRYLGGAGIVSFIADPAQMFDDKYYPLKKVRETYDDSGEKQILYNEMFTLYRFYFDKSIFEVIKQLIPARNVTFSGILIEPTVLERPKYQYKHVRSKACQSDATSSNDILPPTTIEGNRPTISSMDSVYSAGDISSDVVHANFGLSGNMSASIKYTGFYLDLSSVNDPTINYPITYNFGIVPDIQNHEELGVYCDGNGRIIEPVFSGSYTRYLLKKWNRDSVYVKTGEYSKPQTMESQSIYLCSTQVWNKKQYQDNVYTSSIDILKPLSYLTSPPPYFPEYSPVYTYSAEGVKYHHDAGTFKDRPNTKQNNIFFNTVMVHYPTDQYHEVITGYTRNHLTHKKITLSKESFPEVRFDRSKTFSHTRYIKSRQTVDTTIDLSGLRDDTLPIESINVSNINVVKSDNVLNK